MPRIEWEFPITVTVVGTPSPDRLAELGRAVEEALTARLRQAGELLAANRVNRPPCEPAQPEPEEQPELTGRLPQWEQEP
ncbi:hypothetical protein ACFVUN_07015 [Kitasatospora griseola]|uniref:hypothetical protein n=1 Tax=Kitasatospora griseola TaxID=2064 RepID=UPI0036DCD37D